MSTTPNRAYPYPPLSVAPDVPADLAALALAVDVDVAALVAASAARVTGGPTAFTPTWTGGAGLNKGTSTIHGAYWRVGPEFAFQIEIGVVTTGAWNQGSLPWTFGNFGTTDTGTLTSARSIGRWWLAKAGSFARYTGDIMYNFGPPATISLQAGGSSSTAGDAITLVGGGNVPAAWSSGDSITMTFRLPST